MTMALLVTGLQNITRAYYTSESRLCKRRVIAIAIARATKMRQSVSAISRAGRPRATTGASRRWPRQTWNFRLRRTFTGDRHGQRPRERGLTKAGRTCTIIGSTVRPRPTRCMGKDASISTVLPHGERHKITGGTKQITQIITRSAINSCNRRT